MNGRVLSLQRAPAGTGSFRRVARPRRLSEPGSRRTEAEIPPANWGRRKTKSHHQTGAGGRRMTRWLHPLGLGRGWCVRFRRSVIRCRLVGNCAVIRLLYPPLCSISLPRAATGQRRGGRVMNTAGPLCMAPRPHAAVRTDQSPAAAGTLGGAGSLQG